MKKRIVWIITIVLLLVLTSSGWVYVAVESRNNAKTRELSELQTAFAQQYGNEAVMKQLVSVEKVYAAYWTRPDGTPYVSWNVGGVWVTVHIGKTPEAVTTP